MTRVSAGEVKKINVRYDCVIETLSLFKAPFACNICKNLFYIASIGLLWLHLDFLKPFPASAPLCGDGGAIVKERKKLKYLTKYCPNIVMMKRITCWEWSQRIKMEAVIVWSMPQPFLYVCNISKELGLWSSWLFCPATTLSGYPSWVPKRH